MDSCGYIFFSEKLGKFYTGACNDNLIRRIEKHNLHFYGSHKYTATANDWVLFLKIKTDSYSHAIRLERKIKSMKSATYIKNLIKYPELLSKIILQSK